MRRAWVVVARVPISAAPPAAPAATVEAGEAA